LREVSELYGAKACLVMKPNEIPPGFLDGVRSVGVTSGASTPEQLVEDVLGALLTHSPEAKIKTLETIRENVEFKPPRDLIQLAMAKS